MNEDLVLFPGGQLPIVFMKAKEVDFIEKIIGTDQKYIGIVQTLNMGRKKVSFPTGCLGKIVNTTEVDDGHLVFVSGICRFDMTRSMETSSSTHFLNVDYSRYEYDLTRNRYDLSVDRERLLKALKVYMKEFELNGDWEEIIHTSDENLITALAMSGPFSPAEKQAVMESVSLPEQCCIITTLMEMAPLEWEDQGRMYQ